MTYLFHVAVNNTPRCREAVEQNTILATHVIFDLLANVFLKPQRARSLQGKVSSTGQGQNHICVDKTNIERHQSPPKEDMHPVIYCDQEEKLTFITCAEMRPWLAIRFYQNATCTVKQTL